MIQNVYGYDMYMSGEPSEDHFKLGFRKISNQI